MFLTTYQAKIVVAFLIRLLLLLLLLMVLLLLRHQLLYCQATGATAAEFSGCSCKNTTPNSQQCNPLECVVLAPMDNVH